MIAVRSVDDGDGFPADVIGRIGDPFVRTRRADPRSQQRLDSEGMGLGLFIAKTLLERSGAEMSFANATDPFLTPEERPLRCGAVVGAVWAVEDLLAPASQSIGANLRNDV